MPFNGSGIFNPAITFVPNTLATAEDQNTQDTDFASGLTDCMTRDGQAPATANLSLGGNQLNDVANGVAPTDAANLSQVTALLPTGVLFLWTTASAPTGFFLCDGTAYSRTTYANLYTVIGTTFGVGDGTTTFNVPDFRGRAPIGEGQGAGLTNRVLASTGGEETHLLITAEMPTHTHVDSGHTHTDSGHVHAPSGVTSFIGSDGLGIGLEGGSNLTYTLPTATASAVANIQSSTANNQNTGGGGAHNNMQPFLTIGFIIKY